MPIGPSSRPQEPLHIFQMALALTLAAVAGGAFGLLWHWIASDDVSDDQIEAVSEPPAKGEEDEATSPSPAPAPTPQPSPSPR